MERLFAVIRARGPAWDDARGLEEQTGWDAHAAFMDGLLITKQVSPWQLRLGTVG